MGGAFFFHHDSRTTVINCTITGNAGFSGGGILCENSSSPMFRDCTITDNTAVFEGGGIFIWDDASPTFVNCTIAGNTADSGGGPVWPDRTNSQRPIGTFH